MWTLTQYKRTVVLQLRPSKNPWIATIWASFSFRLDLKHRQWCQKSAQAACEPWGFALIMQSPRVWQEPSALLAAARRLLHATIPIAVGGSIPSTACHVLAPNSIVCRNFSNTMFHYNTFFSRGSFIYIYICSHIQACLRVCVYIDMHAHMYVYTVCYSVKQRAAGGCFTIKTTTPCLLLPAPRAKSGLPHPETLSYFECQASLSFYLPFGLLRFTFSRLFVKQICVFCSQDDHEHTQPGWAFAGIS